MHTDLASVNKNELLGVKSVYISYSLHNIYSLTAIFLACLAFCTFQMSYK